MSSFTDGYMHKTAFLNDLALSAIALVGLTLATPAALGLGTGYTIGRFSKGISPEVTKKELERQETAELRNELRFKRMLGAYQRGTPEVERKEIHV